MITIELVTLPVRCMECGQDYKRIVAPPGAPADAFSSGYCPECLPAVEARWFGAKA